MPKIMTELRSKRQAGKLARLQARGQLFFFWLILALAACGYLADLAADTEVVATAPSTPTDASCQVCA